MDIPPPLSPSCSPHWCGGPWLWAKPALPPSMGSCSWGAGMRWCTHPVPAAPSSSTPVPPHSPCQQSRYSPHSSNHPRFPPLTSHSPRAGGRWVQSCTDPGLTVPAPTSVSSWRVSASGQHGRGCFPPLAPRSQNFLGSLQQQPRCRSIPRAAHAPMASAHVGWGRVTGDGRARPGWMPATKRRGAGICAGEERLVLRPPSFPPALMTNKCPTDAVPCRAGLTQPCFGGGLGPGEGVLVWGAELGRLAKGHGRDRVSTGGLVHASGSGI